VTLASRALISAARVAAVLIAATLSAVVAHANESQQDSVRSVVDAAVAPLMKQYQIPGMAVGIALAGQPYLFNYGVKSLETRKPVMRDTLFEIGSVSKTFTATLASYAAVTGRLSLADNVGRYVPSLRGSAFGGASLLSLGTHTPGGLPLQVPDGIQSDDELIAYLKQWKPAYPSGTYRTYSNVGIGMLGFVTAKSMDQNFVALMQGRLFPMLGLKNTYINVPAAKMADYAQGYTTDGAPIRMKAGVLWSEAYGIRTTAPDLLRFVEANMRMIALDATLQRAITQTHTGYFQAGVMTQDLIWEQFPYPVTLQALLQGNSAAMLFNATPVSRIVPPERPRNDVWINKTGSTNGFSTYVAFVPQERLGIVILANKSYPIPDRVRLAYRIVTQLGDRAGGYSSPSNRSRFSERR
jgi:beta-lactamase class C